MSVHPDPKALDRFAKRLALVITPDLIAEMYPAKPHKPTAKEERAEAAEQAIQRACAAVGRCYDLYEKARETKQEARARADLDKAAEHLRDVMARHGRL